jgi:hypothetical protein
MIADFDEMELVVIWFALVREQSQTEQGTQRWAQYDATIRKVEKLLGPAWITPRPTLRVVK